MDLWLVRHAIAEERREGLVDADRQLTKKGEKRFEAIVCALEGLGVRFDVVLTSPWTRAVQTAALLAPLTDVDPIGSDALCRDPDDGLLDAIAAAGASNVAVVGHEPWLSELVSWLVTGETEDGDARFRLKKGGVAHLRGAVHPGQMQLRELLSPKALVAMA